jgi:hypothetical protein
MARNRPLNDHEQFRALYEFILTRPPGECDVEYILSVYKRDEQRAIAGCFTTPEEIIRWHARKMERRRLVLLDWLWSKMSLDVVVYRDVRGAPHRDPESNFVIGLMPIEFRFRARYIELRTLSPRERNKQLRKDFRLTEVALKNRINRLRKAHPYIDGPAWW